VKIAEWLILAGVVLGPLAVAAFAARVVYVNYYDLSFNVGIFMLISLGSLIVAIAAGLITLGILLRRNR